MSDYLVDPVLTVRQLGRGGFSARAMTRREHALVFSTRTGDYVPYLPPLHPSRWQVAVSHYTAVYEVDMGIHPVTEELQLPSANDAFQFTAEVDLSWQVRDPVLFIRSNHRDVPDLLLGEIRRAARPVTRRSVMKDSARAEEELLARLAGAGNPVDAAADEAGLRVRWTLRVRRDQEDLDFEGAWRRSENEEALRGFLARKIEFYQRYLETNGIAKWAVLIAERPDDLLAVVNSMKDEELQGMASELNLAIRLLDDDRTEGFERDELKRAAMTSVRGFFDSRGQRTGPPSDSRPKSAPGWQPPSGYGTETSPHDHDGSAP
ncbi:hypothetical protein [Streptomyces sp. NPDC001100]